ncbi:MAG: hypothetical protein WAR79_07640 [Melioribacteraceae bacterium]
MKTRLIIICTVFIIFAIIINSCKNSIVEPEPNNLLQILLQSNDSVRVEFDKDIICEGKIVYNASLGIAWTKTYENIENGLHEIYYKSYLHNKEISKKIYIEDTLAVLIYYSISHDKVFLVTTNNPFDIE